MAAARKKPAAARKKPDGLVGATEAVIKGAGELNNFMSARAEMLRLLAAKLTGPGVEMKDVQKLAAEWRTALKEFEEGAPRAKSFADKLRDEAGG